MAIKIGGKFVDLSKQNIVEPIISKPVEVKSIPVKSEVQLPSQRKTLIHKTTIDQSHEKPLLVVNGKVIEINKNSTYLIDMLIADEG
jgi:hypothetical protein